MDISFVKINEIEPYEKNPRKNKEAVRYVEESIRQFGFKVPIVLTKGKQIICGHTRWLAAKKLKMNEVPCIFADDLTEEQIRAFRLADNKVSEFAEWDFGLLGEELDDIINIDMSAFGFDNILEDEEEQAEVKEDDIPDEVEEVTKRGDIWIMGDHRLMCGDSTSREDVKRLMGEEKAILVFTDPPYGMKKEKDGVLNDNQNQDELLAFNKKWFDAVLSVTEENGSVYCWGIDEVLMDIYAEIIKPMIRENKATFRNLITWDKKNGNGMSVDGARMYAPVDEKCLFIMLGVQGFNTNSDNYYEGWEPIRSYLNDEMGKCGGKKNWRKALGNQMGSHYFSKSQWQLPTKEAYEKLQAFGREYGAFKREYEEIKCEWYSTRSYFDNTHDNMNSVWHFDRTSAEERELTGGHATPKPIALCARGIKSSSRKGDIVLDVFGGSGSTLIACEQVGRKARMLELSPKYCDVIVARWEKLTGKKAELMRGDQCG